jgi:hypothetical protein
MLTATAVTVTAPAAEAAGRFNYVGWSGGSVVRAVGNTVSSDLTSQSYVAGITAPKSASNNLATAVVENLLRVGAIETSENAVNIEGGIKLTSFARTANVEVLNGLIRADAITTRTVTKGISGQGLSTTGNTEFVNLKIGSATLPVNIPKNYKVSIPGIATVIANGQEVTEKDGIVTSFGYGLKIVLLDAFGPYLPKTVIILNPTFAGMAPEIPVDQPLLFGEAFGSRVHTAAGSGIQVDSGKTASVATNPGGSDGFTVTNSTAFANVPNVLRAGAVFSQTTSLAMTNYGEINNTNEIAAADVLSQLITADAIKTRAFCKRDGGSFSSLLKLNLVNLTIAGNAIPIDVSPNTKITLGDLAEVTINKQVKTGQLAGITGVEIKLLKPQGETPAGALIELSQAWCWIPPF